MRLVRLRLFALVIVVVTGQIATTVVNSVVQFATSASDLTPGEGITCTCAHGPMAECPMHKSHKTGSPTPAPSSRDTRWCNGCGDTSEMVLTSLLFAGPLVDRRQAVAPTSVQEHLSTARARPLDVVLTLESPPPRA